METKSLTVTYILKRVSVILKTPMDRAAITASKFITNINVTDSVAPLRSPNLEI